MSGPGANFFNLSGSTLVLEPQQPSRHEPSGVHDPAFRVLVTSGCFEPGFRGGGPIHSVAQIIDTAPKTIDLMLITSDRDLGMSVPYAGLSGRVVQRNNARVFYLNTGSWRQWMRLWRELRSTPFDLLYTNSLLSPVFTLLPILAVRLGLIEARALAIAPRGEMSPGALSLKSVKKRLFLRWCNLLLGIEVIWHASAEREATEIIAVFPSANVVINPDQVSLPPDAMQPILNPGAVRIVFISRICRKKNLQLILEALAGQSGPIDLDIYGPIEDHAYWKYCQSLMTDLPPGVRAQYCGELEHGEVTRTFAQYDAFVLPTLGENFGHVIAESLSAACPVVCSDRTPWTDVLEAGGGRVIQHLTTEDWAAELERLAALSPQDRLRDRKKAGAAYVAWSRAAAGKNFLEVVQLDLAR
jgi:glycosyltransferase involved in cell wall biosynthesis